MSPDRKTTTLLPDVRQVRADDEHTDASAEYVAGSAPSSGWSATSSCCLSARRTLPAGSLLALWLILRLGGGPAEGDLAMKTAALLVVIAGRRSSRRWRLLEREWRTNQATCLGWAGVPANPHARGVGACRCRAGLPAAPPRTAARGLRGRWCLRPAWRAEISIICSMLPVPGRSAVVGVARTAGCHRVRRVGRSRSSRRRVGGGTGRRAAAPGR